MREKLSSNFNALRFMRYLINAVPRYRNVSKSLLRQHRLGVNAQGGPSSYEPTVGAALHRALAEGSDADGGWQHRAANVGNASGRGHKPNPGESVSALCVRHVDGETVSTHPVRALRG